MNVTSVAAEFLRVEVDVCSSLPLDDTRVAHAVLKKLTIVAHIVKFGGKKIFL